jgi:thiol-disulfide isomerase/thioredoxin
MTFEGLDGSAVTFIPAPGHVTFVNVFATWCPPCRGETPDLAAFAASEAGKDVDVIGIDQQESPAAVDAFRAEFHTAYPMIIDTGRTTKDLLGARIIPRTLVLDGSGIVKAVVSGPMTRDQMDRLAAAAASGS